MVPFYGQGMNCAFEDCLLLDDALDAHASRKPSLFAPLLVPRGTVHSARVVGDEEVVCLDGTPAWPG